MGNEKIIRNPETNCEVLVSHEEEKYRRKFPKFEATKNKQLKCTVCSVNLTPFIESGKSCHLHGFLKVLVCKKCLDFYGYGDFSTDEDGDEKYCRWCGQGGNLFLCDKCNSGFCKACVKRNFSRDVFEDLKKQDKWDCFMCNPKPLYELRAKAWTAEKHYLSHRKEDKKSKNSKQEEDEPKVSKSRSKEDTLVKSEQKFIDAARKILLKSLDQTKRLTDQCKQQSEKIQKTKITKKNLKKAEDIMKLESKIQLFFNSITENVEDIRSDLTKSLAEWQKLYDDKKCQVNGNDNNVEGDGDKAKDAEENGCNEIDAEEKKTDAEEGQGDEEKEENKADGVKNGGGVAEASKDVIEEEEEEEEEDDVGEEDSKSPKVKSDEAENDGDNEEEEEEEEEKEKEMETSLNDTGVSKESEDKPHKEADKESSFSDPEDTQLEEAATKNSQDDQNTTVGSKRSLDDTTLDSDESVTKLRKM